MSDNDRSNTGIGIGGFILRLVMALALVLLTYNPTNICFVHWLRESISAGEVGALQALAGIVLVIGWAIFLNTARDSLGMTGVVLGVAFFAALIWVLIEFDLLEVGSGTALTWIVLVCLAALLAIGMSWGHWKRQASGQLDVDQ